MTTGAATPERIAAAPLLEREAQLAVLEAALASARAGSGRLVVVDGAAGIGKSRLLREAAERARAAGMTVLTARGGEAETDYTFGLVLQLFQLRVAAADTAEQEALFEGPAALAASLLLPGSAPPEPNFSILHGLFWLSYRLAGDGGLLLVLDDVHWADVASLRFVHYLAQRLDELPVTIVLAARPREAGASEQLLDELRAHPVAQVLQPPPLSDGAVAQVVRASAADAPETFCRACGEATQGNPFLLHELLRALAVDGTDYDDRAAERVRGLGAETVARAVLLRLARLPREAAALARIVAVLEEAPLAQSAALAGLEADTAGEAADGLAAVEILRPGDPLAFVHPLVRRSVYVDLPARERDRLHREAARLLADEGEPVERVAAHLVASAPGREPWVVETLLAAAERATALGSPEAAVHYLARALAEPPEDAERGEVLAALGLAEAAAGEAGALEHLREALPLLRAGRRDEIGLATGRVLLAHGRFDDAAAIFAEALAAAEPCSGVAVELHASLLQARTMAGELSTEDLRPLVAELMPDGRPRTHGHRILLAQLAVQRLLAADGTAAEVVDICERALDDGALLAEDGSDGMTYHLITGTLGYADGWPLIEPVLAAAFDDAQRRGSIPGYAAASFCRSGLDYNRGRLKEALAHAEAAIDCERYGWRLYLPMAHVHLCGIRLELGDVAGARAAIEPVLAGDWERTVLMPAVLHTLGDVYAAEGELERALEQYLRSGEAIAAVGISNPNVLEWRSSAARVLVRLNRRAEARPLAREELELAQRFGSRSAIARALAAVGLAEGGDEGVELLREAVATAEAADEPVLLPRLLLDFGAALRRSGARAQAREPLRRAVELARAAGLTVIAETAAEELRTAGGRARPAQRSGRDELTPSELRVVELAVDGLSNREIAQTLFVTPKAVEWHLGNAYRKLGIRSRRELAPALA